MSGTYMLKLVPLLKEQFSFYVYSGSEFTLVKCERFCFFLFITSGFYLMFFFKVCFLMIAII